MLNIINSKDVLIDRDSAILFIEGVHKIKDSDWLTITNLVDKRVVKPSKLGPIIIIDKDYKFLLTKLDEYFVINADANAEEKNADANVINANIINAAEKNVIFYSKSEYSKILKNVANFKNIQFLKNMSEEVCGNILTLDEMFINFENAISRSKIILDDLTSDIILPKNNKILSYLLTEESMIIFNQMEKLRSNKMLSEGIGEVCKTIINTIKCANIAIELASMYPIKRSNIDSIASANIDSIASADIASIASADIAPLITNKGPEYQTFIDSILSIINLCDKEIYNIEKHSEHFEIDILRIERIILMIKNTYDSIYLDNNKSYTDYIDNIYEVLMSEVNYFHSQYNLEHQKPPNEDIYTASCIELLNLKKSINQIGEVCEFVFYFVGSNKYLTRQTCESLFNYLFTYAFKSSHLYNSKKKEKAEIVKQYNALSEEISRLNNPIVKLKIITIGKEITKLEIEKAKYQSLIKIKMEKNKGKSEIEKIKLQLKKIYEEIFAKDKKIKMINNELEQMHDMLYKIEDRSKKIDEEIIYIKEVYKIFIFIIFYGFVEYPLSVKYFRKMSKYLLLYNIHQLLLKCDVNTYMYLFPEIINAFTILDEGDKEVAINFIKNEIYPIKKIEDIIIDPKNGTIAENIISELFNIEVNNNEIIIAKNIAIIVYIACYYYI